MAKKPPALLGGGTQKPDRETIRRMLDDVEAVTKSRFYEDPDPVASPVEMFLVRDGKQGGEPFAELSVREKVQVLGDYTNWSDYEKRGVSFEQMDQVYWNVVQGKPREQWLEGTGLDGRPAASPPTMQEVLTAAREALERQSVQEKQADKGLAGYLTKAKAAPKRDKTKGRGREM